MSNIRELLGMVSGPISNNIMIVSVSGLFFVVALVLLLKGDSTSRHDRPH